jgi:FtsP/CotA-like multicopper oxidase with cupredoxin domain
MNRRDFLGLLGASALSGLSILARERVFAADDPVSASSASKTGVAPDWSLRIAPVKLELSPGHTITTVGYNGAVPGPLLRVNEGRRVTIEVRNDSDVAELVHWHGLMVRPPLTERWRRARRWSLRAAPHITPSSRGPAGRDGITRMQ